MITSIHYVAPHMIRAHHEVTRKRQLKALVTSMKAHGWRGRPVLGERLADGRVQAWTASHRIAAARKAGLRSIPVRFLDREVVAKALLKAGFVVGDVLLLSTPPRWYDPDRAKFLKDAGDLIGAALLRLEMEENAREDRKKAWRRGKSAAA